jgi:hypothetical protein
MTHRNHSFRTAKAAPAVGPRDIAPSGARRQPRSPPPGGTIGLTFHAETGMRKLAAAAQRARPAITLALRRVRGRRES